MIGTKFPRKRVRSLRQIMSFLEGKRILSARVEWSKGYGEVVIELQGMPGDPGYPLRKITLSMPMSSWTTLTLDVENNIDRCNL